MISDTGLPLMLYKPYTALTTSIPDVTLPKATDRPSRCPAASVVIKNCDPFVCRPELAMVSKPGELRQGKTNEAKVSEGQGRVKLVRDGGLQRHANGHHSVVKGWKRCLTNANAKRTASG